MRHTFDIQAAGRDVGSDQDIEAPIAQPLHSALALRLGDIAIQRLGGESAGTELFRKFYRLGLGAHKNNQAVESLGLEDAGQGVELVKPLDRPVTLADVLRRGGLRGDPDPLRCAQVAFGYCTDSVRHRR